ncbi:MAG: hypothetical protein IJT69_02930 [Clostridia bacterium]|nr:hypothetical protein [Clostridia bacterium]
MARITYSIKDEDGKLFPTIKNLIISFTQSHEHESFPFRVEGDSVIYADGSNEYWYSLGGRSATGQGEQVYMDANGASWFKTMRGDGDPDDSVKASNHWQILIRKLSETFYANNFFFYCDLTSERINEINDIEAENNIGRFVETCFGEKLEDIELRKVDTTDQYVYAASFRFEVSKSIGAPQPVLGRVYYLNKSDGTTELLSVQDATELDRSLESFERDSNDAVTEEKNINTTIDHLIENIKSRDHLEKNIVFNEDNQAVIKRIVDPSFAGSGDPNAMKSEEIQIDIKKATVNTIFKIKVNAKTYEVYYKRFTERRTPVLRVDILFNKISMRCLSCNEDIVVGNVIEYCSAGETQRKRAELSFESDAITFRDPTDSQKTSEDILYELKESVFSEHLYPVSGCPTRIGRGNCFGYVCRNDQIAVKDIETGEKIIRCKKCPFPESFVIVDGGAYTTSSVFFDVNERRLRLKKDEHGECAFCSTCGRRFYQNADEWGEQCALCASLSDGDVAVTNRQKETYRAYRGFLPIRLRLAGRKRCAEDESAITFKIGDKYYSFNKIDAILSGERSLEEKREKEKRLRKERRRGK